MPTKPELPPLSPVAHFIAAALAAVIAIGVLDGVTELLQRDGRPMARLAAAERACMGRAYVSERESCMRQWAAAARSAQLASK